MIRHIAANWSMDGLGWSLEQRLTAAKAAGFDGIGTGPQPELATLAKKHGLIVYGYISTGTPAEFEKLLRACKDAGAQQVDVQLADDDTLTPEALGLTLLMMQAAQRVGVEAAIEIHRDTCTETPEKTYALADAYKKVTGETLHMTWDFSHLAVVKHLRPANYIERLITRPDLIQRSQQFHFRPFNGHHCQVPVTDGKGNLTKEVQDYLPFVEAVFKCWLAGNPDPKRELFAIPEMGPVPGGYNLSTLPNSWEDAKVLRGEIDKIWQKLTK